MPNLYFPIASLFCSLLILLLMVVKKKMSSIENTFYFWMVISSLLDCLFLIAILLIAYTNYNDNTKGIIIFLNKMDFIHYILWPSMLFLYVFYTIYSNDKYEILRKRVLKIVLLILFVSIITEALLPIKLFNQNGAMAAFGLSVDFIYIISFIYCLGIILILLINYKSIFQKKYIPIFALILFLLIGLYLRKVNPTLPIIPALISYVNLIMYFTIENPDLQVIKVLSEYNDIAKQSNVSKSQFILDISDEISTQINNLTSISNEIEAKNKNPELDPLINQLKNCINSSKNKFINTIDISSFDEKHINIMNSFYNPKKLFWGISEKFKEKVNDKIEFRLNYNDEIPDELYGDAIKMKQVILSLLDNSLKNTKQGFIELRVHAFTKNDLCRLIVVVEDSGIGMDIFKINEVYSNHQELTDEQINNISSLNVDLVTIKKIVTLMSGTLIIESKENSGTTITVTFNQKIKENTDYKENNEFNSYVEKYDKIPKIAIISNNKENIKDLKRAINNNFKVEIYNETINCLNALRNKSIYKIIFIEKKMDKIDAQTFLIKTKAIENFNSKVVVISSNNNFDESKDLLNQGFYNVVNIPINYKKIKDLLN